MEQNLTEKLLPYLFPAALTITAIVLFIKEYLSFKENIAGGMPAKVRLLRRLIGTGAMLAASICIITGIRDLHLKNINFFPWAGTLVFLLITMFVSVWDASSELNILKRDMKKNCEEEMLQLLKEYEKKAEEKIKNSSAKTIKEDNIPEPE